MLRLVDTHTADRRSWVSEQQVPRSHLGWLCVGCVVVAMAILGGVLWG